MVAAHGGEAARNLAISPKSLCIRLLLPIIESSLAHFLKKE
jgi:hypothetical protein